MTVHNSSTQYSKAQNIPDNIPSYSPENYQSSDGVHVRALGGGKEGGVASEDKYKGMNV